ncbi:MAG: sigma-54-dependent Fis family transcriptional regulator [candidate division WOR-3 bacterium]|nr:sigma-54-dependent Fis family transcriptional regulator [candidate division WOR-3 bacterium]
MNQKLPEHLDVLQSLYKASEIINSTVDYSTLLERIMDTAIKTVNAERGFLMLKDMKSHEMKVEVARNLNEENIIGSKEISMTPVYKAIETGESILTSDAKKDPRLKESKSIVMYNLLSILVVPITRKDDIIGVIYLDSLTNRNVFDEKSREFMTAFANLAALSIENARLANSLTIENRTLKREMSYIYNFEHILGTSQAIREVLDILKKVINTDVPILLEGESGTGKGLIARTIHFNSQRKDKKFISQYCGALPETLLESELFGYKKGAFTGANSNKMGLFEAADGGTFFLDEVGDLTLTIQTKLLRVLQEHKIRRIGDTEDRIVDVRIISATNKLLADEVKSGNFREDLYYRLKVVRITIPPLRERKEDIPVLIKSLLANEEINRKEIEGVSKDAMKTLINYNWPGNIRELENVIQHAIVMSETRRIEVRDLPSEISNERIIRKNDLSKSLKEMEKDHILDVLENTEYSRKEAADILGISLRTLQYKLKKYNVNDKSEER